MRAHLFMLSWNVASCYVASDMAVLKCDGAETAMSRKAPDEKDKDPFKIDAAWERELKHVFRRYCVQGGLAGLLDHLPSSFALFSRVLADEERRPSKVVKCLRRHGA